MPLQKFTERLIVHVVHCDAGASYGEWCWLNCIVLHLAVSL